MKNSLLVLFAFITQLNLHAQDHFTGTIDKRSDWRTFTVQTAVSVSRTPFKMPPNTVGNKFLFPDFVSGKVVNKEGVEFSGDGFNYDKMSQSVFIKIKDTDVVFQVDKEQLKTISLSDGTTTYNLETIPSSKDHFFYNVVFKGPKYSLYSLTKTKFIASDYNTNGIVTTGNLYDEYKDESQYFILTPKHELLKLSSFKEKAIRNLLDTESGKLDSYFSSHKGKVDEVFMKELVEYLNSAS